MKKFLSALGCISIMVIVTVFPFLAGLSIGSKWKTSIPTVIFVLLWIMMVVFGAMMIHFYLSDKEETKDEQY